MSAGGEPRQEVRIVRAMPAQAAELSHIARTAKAHWGYPDAWLEAWRDFFTIRPEAIGAGGYLVAVAGGGQSVGFCAVCRMPGDGWRLEHLWVLPEWHGCGVGGRLFEAAAAFVHERGGGAFEIEADPHAEGFYLRMGAVRTGEVDATMEGVPRVLPELRYVLP